MYFFQPQVINLFSIFQDRSCIIVKFTEELRMTCLSSFFAWKTIYSIFFSSHLRYLVLVFKLHFFLFWSLKSLRLFLRINRSLYQGSMSNSLKKKKIVLYTAVVYKVPKKGFFSFFSLQILFSPTPNAFSTFLLL